MQDQEIAESLVQWLKSNNPLIDSVDHDVNLLQAGIIDSFKFVNFLVYIESLRGESISREKVTPEAFESINVILRNFFAHD